jgi:hypothetical protein
MDPDKPECRSPSQSLQQSLQQQESRPRDSEQTEAAVMAAVDDTGADERLVIADTTRDDAWLDIDAEDGLTLADWR